MSACFGGEVVQPSVLWGNVNGQIATPRARKRQSWATVLGLLLLLSTFQLAHATWTCPSGSECVPMTYTAWCFDEGAPSCHGNGSTVCTELSSPGMTVYGVRT